MGRSGSGKTSMRSMIFNNYSANETSRLGATLYVERTEVRFLNNLNLSILDCAGQDNLMKNILMPGNNQLALCQVLIYVFDVSNIEEPKDYITFVDVIKRLNQTSPSCKFFILFHKWDLVMEHEKETAKSNIISALIKSGEEIKFHELYLNGTVKIFTTTIWNETLYLAWSRVVEELVPKANIMKNYLKKISRVLNAKELIIFERKSFLSIVSYSNMFDQDNFYNFNSDRNDGYSHYGVTADRSQKISSIIKTFRKSASYYNGGKFQKLTLHSRSSIIYLDELTDTMAIMLVLPNAMLNESPINQQNINNGNSGNYLQNNQNVSSSTNANENNSMNYNYLNSNTSVKNSFEDSFIGSVIKTARDYFQNIDFGSN
ncbi:Rag GTPase GTR1 ASCRUDRAFT_78360 [Ascoidea rubescens DSM 1968]|uniref:GTP-binding protein n=1 Tax=Ascoidea rubescens DSM 1968 TaxID=1344418 RepID=A0A1D2V857_9ASCO|nr:hypothetical protein ASCRUDRAFT_78360 [Ascoidea rubescens DSM 1968]ODV57836.1 hypothetical protein ASCRUDRAFT_78360 [Ascoidea rubescens DSM 1968]